MGPVVLDGLYLGRPQAFLAVPGSDFGLFLVLERATEGAARLGIEAMSGPRPDGSFDTRFAIAIGTGERVPAAMAGGYTIEFVGTSSWTGLVVRRDLGQPVIWMAFALLVSGLVITFYLPRSRVWVRISGDRAQMAVLADRYVDTRRELERVITSVTGAGPHTRDV